MKRNLQWRKSSFSGGNGGNCVEVADANGEIWVRNSKNPAAGHVVFTRSELDAFMKGVRAGEFDDLI